jgi:hypothetical protein
MNTSDEQFVVTQHTTPLSTVKRSWFKRPELTSTQVDEFLSLHESLATPKSTQKEQIC